MTYYIAVFTSRTETIRFNEILNRNNVSSQVINTPREASVGCGVSVKFSPQDFENVKRIYGSVNLSLTGFFKVARYGRSFVVTPI